MHYLIQGKNFYHFGRAQLCGEEDFVKISCILLFEDT
jgi:hypothetical protein